MSHSYFAGETVNCCQHIRDLQEVCKNPGFPRSGRKDQKGGWQTHYLPKFAENCMKMKKGGGGRSFFTLIRHCLWIQVGTGAINTGFSLTYKSWGGGGTINEQFGLKPGVCSFSWNLHIFLVNSQKVGVQAPENIELKNEFSTWHSFHFFSLFTCRYFTTLSKSSSPISSKCSAFLKIDF